MFPLPGTLPGAPALPPLDFSAGPSNAAASLSTPINVGGLTTGGTDMSLMVVLAVAAFLLLK